MHGLPGEDGKGRDEVQEAQQGTQSQEEQLLKKLWRYVQD
jgi:hypothetical protein